MIRRSRSVVARLAALAALVGATGAGVAVPAAPAQAATACPSSQVTVVVDFGSLGGTSVACATSFSSGLAALSSAGHGWTSVPRQPGFVCTIDAKPDPCNGAPANAYWSYWHAKPGGSWTYSSTGAGSYHPAAGSVEGWAFGSGAKPGVAPPSAASAPKPSTTSSTASTPRSTTTTSGGSGGSGGSSGGGGTTRSHSTTAAGRPAGGASTAAPSGTASASSRTPSARPTSASVTATASASAADSTAAAGTPTVASTPTGSSGSDDTPGPALYAGLGAIVLLGAAGGAVAWRRRDGAG